MPSSFAVPLLLLAAYRCDAWGGQQQQTGYRDPARRFDGPPGDSYGPGGGGGSGQQQQTGYRDPSRRFDGPPPGGSGSYGPGGSGQQQQTGYREPSRGFDGPPGRGSYGSGGSGGGENWYEPGGAAPMQPMRGGAMRPMNNNNNDYYYGREERYDRAMMGGAGGVVQGGSRRTFSSPPGGGHPMDNSEYQEILLGNPEGRPVEADVSLWEGPDNTASRITGYSENGSRFPMNVYVRTDDPRDVNGGGGRLSRSVDVRNSGPLEFPLRASVGPSGPGGMGGYGSEAGAAVSPGAESDGPVYVEGRIVQGGARKDYHIPYSAGPVKVILTSNDASLTSPIEVKLEVLQGPGRVAQTYNIYEQKGREVVTFVDTGGQRGCTVSVINMGPLEFPVRVAIVGVAGGGMDDGYGGGGMGMYPGMDRNMEMGIDGGYRYY